MIYIFRFFLSHFPFPLFSISTAQGSFLLPFYFFFHLLRLCLIFFPSRSNVVSEGLCCFHVLLNLQSIFRQIDPKAYRNISLKKQDWVCIISKSTLRKSTQSARKEIQLCPSSGQLVSCDHPSRFIFLFPHVPPQYYTSIFCSCVGWSWKLLSWCMRQAGPCANMIYGDPGKCHIRFQT